MNLYIDTSGASCELALFAEGKVMDSIIHQERHAHSVVIHDLIAKLLSDNQLNFADLKAVAVLNGPGSYTGLRVGLASAKGYCFSLDIPLVLLNKIDLFLDFYQSQQPDSACIAYLELARSEEYFFSLRKHKSVIADPTVYKTEEIEEIISQHQDCMLLADNKELEFKHHSINCIEVPKEFIASAINKRLMANEVDDLFSAEPFYLKKVHANIAKKRF